MTIQMRPNKGETNNQRTMPSMISNKPKQITSLLGALSVWYLSWKFPIQRP